MTKGASRLPDALFYACPSQMQCNLGLCNAISYQQHCDHHQFPANSAMATVPLKVPCFTVEYLTLQYTSKRTRRILARGEKDVSDNLVISGPGRPHIYNNLQHQLGTWLSRVRRLGACLYMLSIVNMLGVFSNSLKHATQTAPRNVKRVELTDEVTYVLLSSSAGA